MSATDTIVKNAIADYRKAIFDEVENRCRTFCSNLCQQAIQERERAPRKHNFTGNLLNSIVVCLYRESVPVAAYYAGEHVAQAIRVKMTYPRRYKFKKDYEGVQSHYNPTVVTDKGWGVDDARKFFQSYRPAGKNLFDIVVAYPTEYAEWVEMKRASTGIMGTYAYVERFGVQILQLPLSTGSFMGTPFPF